MSELLRAYDQNAVRRKLHDLLFDVHFEFAIDRSNIPHTYDTRDLLAYSERILRRRDMRGTELHRELLFRTAVAHCVAGSKKTGLELFEKGTRLSDYPPDQSLFNYGIAQWIHRKNGARAEARQKLLQARKQSERGRHLRTEIDLALGAIHAAEGDGFAATRRYQRILRRGVLELRPMARLLNVQALIAQGLIDAAWAENEAAKDLVTGSPDWRLRIRYDINRARLHQIRGENAKALPVQKKVLDAHYRRLDTSLLAAHYANHALVLRKLGRLDDALEQGLEAVRLVGLMDPRTRARVHRNLALLLNEMGRPAEALGALDIALDVAREHAIRDYEFKTLVAAAEVYGGLPGDAVPGLLARCRQLLEAHGAEIPRDSLEEYVQVTSALGRIRGEAVSRPREIKRVSRAGDKQAFNSLTGDRQTPDFERDARGSLGNGMAFEDAPKTAALARFLMLYTGDSFKSMSYQREFQKSQPRAKYHLQWLVNEKILERMGTRKAAVYILAFHRS